MVSSSLATVAAIELVLRTLLPARFGEASKFVNVPGRYRHRSAHSDVLVEINRLGLRGPEPALRKAQGTTRVLAIGDSATWGELIEFADTYPEVAARILNGGATRRYEFVNISRPAAGLPEYLGYWRKAGIKFRPEVVVIGFFVGNDFFSVVNPYVVTPPQPRSRWRQFQRLIESRLAAIRQLQLLWRSEPTDINELWYGSGEARALANPLHEQNLNRQAQRLGIPPEVVRERLRSVPEELRRQALEFDLAANLFAAAVLHPASPRQSLAMSDPKVLASCRAAMRVLDELIAEIRAAGAWPVILAIPRREQVAQHYAADLRTLGFDVPADAANATAPQDYLAEHALRAGVALVDPLGALQQEESRGGGPLYFRYDGHLTPAGNRVLGECLARTITEHADRGGFPVEPEG